jgi:CheY-like chemotaxis protein
MPHRVLVVDDEEAIRSLAKDYLEGKGYRVTSAVDGAEGIKAFKNDQPHLVIIDFLLPKKNGFAVAEAIRRDDKRAQTPIIMMSGVFKNPKTAVEAREKYRVVDFLSKPLDMAKLATLIARSLEGVDPGEDLAEEPVRERPAIQSPPDRDDEPQLSAPSMPARSNGEDFGDSIASVLDDGVPPPRGLSYFGRGPSMSVGAANVVPAVRPKALDKAPAPRTVSNLDEHYKGRPFPVLPDEGDVEQLPVALLLSIIRYDTLTGMLDLTEQGTHRRLYIVRGLPTFMQSNAEGENVGALLLRRGRITEPDFQRCMAYMKQKGRTMQQSLLELRLANEHDLSTAYKLLAGQLLPLALGMAAGKFKWRESDAFIGRVPEGNFEPVQVLFEGIKRHVHPPQILKFFKGREDVPLLKTNEFDKLMPFFRRAFSANNIASEIGGRATYREITRKHSAQAASVVPQLFALATSGMAFLPEVSEQNRMEIAVNAAASEIAEMSELGTTDGEGDLQMSGDEDSGQLSPEEKRARAAINRYHEEIHTKDFFQIFNVEREADAEKIKAVYFDLAKKWHQDAYSGMNLGGERPKLDAIFGRITEAYETITDKQKREEYIVYLDRQSKGLSTDVNQIFRAEQLFDQAQAMIRRRDYANARTVLEEAIQLNPGDALYYANLGWVVFSVDTRSQENLTEAVNLLKKAITEQENCPIAYQYLGQIAFTRGQAVEAKKWWQRCLEWEPNNIEASRGLRMLASRDEKERQAKGGLLNKFLNKK